MSISFSCEQCGDVIDVSESSAGTMKKCFMCGFMNTVPGRPPLGQAAAPPVQGVAPTADQSLQPGGAMVTAVPPPTISMEFSAELEAANSMISAGKYVEVLQVLQGLAHQAEAYPIYYYLCGVSYSGLGNYANALSNYTRVIEEGMHTAPAYAAKGQAELALGHYAAAVQSMDRALDLAGTDVPDYMACLARAYEGLNMHQDATVTWNALSQINPNHPALVQKQQNAATMASQAESLQMQESMLQMQKEQRASDTACWICVILRCLLECL